MTEQPSPCLPLLWMPQLGSFTLFVLKVGCTLPKPKPRVHAVSMGLSGSFRTVRWRPWVRSGRLAFCRAFSEPLLSQESLATRRGALSYLFYLLGRMTALRWACPGFPKEWRSSCLETNFAPSNAPDPWADPKSRSTSGFHNLHHRGIGVKNWGSTSWILPGPGR